MKKIILFLSLFTLSLTQSYAIDERVESLYSNFVTSIESRYSSEKQKMIYESVRERANTLIEQNRFSESKLSILQDLESLNNEQLFSLWMSEQKDQSTQIALENRMRPAQSPNKIPFSRLAWEFHGFLTPEMTFIERDGYYYGYNFTTFRYYNDIYGVFQADLDASWFSRGKDYIYRDENGRYNFITNIKETRLISVEDVFGLPNKHLILDALREDAKADTQNIESTFSQIAAISKNLARWKSKSEATEEIYAWILENISYSTVLDLSDQRIFSAIETFKNKSWVCTWYTKLMLYMLAFAWVQDAEVIRWQVIDAADFPEIGHAWLRIWDRYYDPTFDDPVGAVKTKSASEYTYYGLPKDIFYANRFEYQDLPEAFKTKTDEEIRQYIFNYLTALLPKYEWVSKYDNVFAPVIYRKRYNISPLTNTTPELLAEKIWYYESDGTFRYVKNWKTKQITGIRYFIIDTENTERVLEQLWYNTDDLQLFLWTKEDGSREWRLVYELTEV